MSLWLRATALLAGVLAGVYLTAAFLIDGDSPLQLAVLLLATLTILATAFFLWIHRPLRAMVERSHRRLGGDERDARVHRDEIRELGHLMDNLIAAFTATGGRTSTAQGIREDLERMRALNRQLMDVATLGKEIAAALPYRETVERVLSRSKGFLRADYAALVLLDAETRAFTLEGAQGVMSPTQSADCCAFTADCPVRQAIAGGHLTRVSGHACTLFPHTMKHLLVIPVSVENVGEMALIAASTGGERLGALTDDVLEALRSHIQTALTNAHKYDAIRRQVVTDHLTRLYNRRYFINRAGEEIARSLRHQSPLSVLMIDIDHFKDFNDKYGHATGDRVLQTVARALQVALRTSDICARYGGEEFAVLLPSTPGESACFVAERVRRTLSDTRYTGLGLPADVNVTISVGVATCPRDATRLESLIELADKALYRAKAGGRNQVALYGAAEAGHVCG